MAGWPVEHHQSPVTSNVWGAGFGCQATSAVAFFSTRMAQALWLVRNPADGPCEFTHQRILPTAQIHLQGPEPRSQGSLNATSTFPAMGHSIPELCDAIWTAPGLQPPTPASLCWDCLGLDYGTSRGSHPHNLIGIC